METRRSDGRLRRVRFKVLSGPCALKAAQGVQYRQEALWVARPPCRIALVSSPLILGPAACSGPGSAPQWWVGQWAAVDRAPIDTTGLVASGRVPIHPIHPIHDPVQGNVTSPLLLLVHPLLRADNNTRGEPQTGRPFTHCIALRASPAAIPPPLCAELGKWFLGFWCFSFSFLFSVGARPARAPR